MSRRVAVLGGTFDPVHRAHVSVLEQVVAALSADAGLLVPAARPALRPEPVAGIEARLEMAAAAVRGRTRLCVDDLEARRPGPSYTVDSVAEWRRRNPGDEIHLILGADAARLIRQWHRNSELLESAHFAIVNRSGAARIDVAEAVNLGFPAATTRLITIVSPDLSATAVRARLASGDPCPDALDPEVLAIIRSRGLYGFRVASSRRLP